MHNSNSYTTEIFLAFDFGLRRIGVAVGQALTRSATPLPLLPAQKGRPDWTEVEKLITAWHPAALIVGIPYKMDGGEQAMSLAARTFARQLKERFHLPIHTIDERLTTREAQHQISSRHTQRRTQPALDSYAAKLILEAWLNQA